MLNEQEVAAMVAENKKLKTENTRLRKKLGLPIEKPKKKPTLKKSLQNMKIEKLNLSERTIKALNSGGILTLGELVSRDHIDLISFKNVGMKTVTEIEEALAKLSLHLDYYRTN